MDRYKKVEQQRTEVGPIHENEIRITSQGLVRNYISYATSLLQERKGREIVFKAMGQAISKTVAIAEIIKRRIPQLHQDTVISSVSITDVWEPIEEGLLRVEQTRHVSMISITLSPSVLDKNSPGYQAPALKERSRPQYNNYQQQQPPRQGRVTYNAVNEDSYGQGQGRGRGRGWSRGGYGDYQENGGYSNWNRDGRGRSGGHRGGYHRGPRYGNSYENGSGYERGGYEQGPAYEGGGRNGRGRGGGRRGGGYYRDDGYEQGPVYEGGGRNDRDRVGGRRGGGYARGGSGGRGGYENDQGPVYEGGAGNGRGSGYERGRGGGYGRGRGRMGGRGRGGGYLV